MSGKSLGTKRVIAAYAVGNALEWYDFIVYALLISTISRLFFPADNEFVSLLFAFGTFAVSYIVRPLGGLFFGAYADVRGRKYALAQTFFCMALATTLLAMLPTYATIGVLAPILLIVLRCLQGFSAGGEFGSSTSALLEIAPPHRKGLYCSIQLATQAVAVVIAAIIIFMLTKNLAPDDFDHWGWRVPFAVGALLCPIGLYIRHRLNETLEFEREKRLEPVGLQKPITDIASGHKKLFLSVICLFAAITGPNYINTVYLPSVASEFYGLQRQDAILGVLLAAIVVGFAVPFFGWLSDKIGPYKVSLGGLIFGVIVYSIVYVNFVTAPTMVNFVIMQGLYAIPYSAVLGGGCLIAMDRFPVLVRATGSGTSYNIASIVFGGMAPFWLFVVALLIGSFGPLIYFSVLALLGVYGIWGANRDLASVSNAKQPTCASV